MLKGIRECCVRWSRSGVEICQLEERMMVESNAALKSVTSSELQLTQSPTQTGRQPTTRQSSWRIVNGPMANQLVFSRERSNYD